MAGVAKPYYLEFGLDPETPLSPPSRKPFDAESCAIIEEFKPEIVSFHFGLPAKHLLDRVKATKARVIASATTVREALRLESHGCDAIIAMGFEEVIVETFSATTWRGKLEPSR
jgi:nitronate monooxygenase